MCKLFDQLSGAYLGTHRGAAYVLCAMCLCAMCYVLLYVLLYSNPDVVPINPDGDFRNVIIIERIKCENSSLKYQTYL